MVKTLVVASHQMRRRPRRISQFLDSAILGSWRFLPIALSILHCSLVFETDAECSESRHCSMRSKRCAATATVPLETHNDIPEPANQNPVVGRHKRSGSEKDAVAWFAARVSL